jgi:hypothetical protein
VLATVTATSTGARRTAPAPSGVPGPGLGMFAATLGTRAAAGIRCSRVTTAAMMLVMATVLGAMETAMASVVALAGLPVLEATTVTTKATAIALGVTDLVGTMDAAACCSQLVPRRWPPSSSARCYRR